MMASIVLTAALAGSVSGGMTGWPDISAPPPRTTNHGATDVALIIAIEDYAYAPDILGAVQNGRDWYTWLTRAHGVPEENVAFLYDKAATREQILARASEIANVAEPGGRVWLIFIGHGAPDAKTQDGRLVGADAQQTPASLSHRGVGLFELQDRLSSGAHKEVVMIQDACFSGKTPDGDLAPGFAPFKAVSVEPGPGWTVLAAARNDQAAGALSDQSRPAFSYLVLGALRGWGDANRDGKVTDEEAVEYARQAMWATVPNYDQQPERRGPAVRLARSGGERPPDLSKVVLSLQSKSYSTRTESGDGFGALAQLALDVAEAVIEASGDGQSEQAAVGGSGGLDAKQVPGPETGTGRQSQRNPSSRTPSIQAKRRRIGSITAGSVLAATGGASVANGLRLSRSYVSEAEAGLLTPERQEARASEVNTWLAVGVGATAIGLGVGIGGAIKFQPTATGVNVKAVW